MKTNKQLADKMFQDRPADTGHMCEGRGLGGWDTQLCL